MAKKFIKASDQDSMLVLYNMQFLNDSDYTLYLDKNGTIPAPWSMNKEIADAYGKHRLGIGFVGDDTDTIVTPIFYGQGMALVMYGLDSEQRFMLYLDGYPEDARFPSRVCLYYHDGALWYHTETITKVPSTDLGKLWYAFEIGALDIANNTNDGNNATIKVLSIDGHKQWVYLIRGGSIECVALDGATEQPPVVSNPSASAQKEPVLLIGYGQSNTCYVVGNDGSDGAYLSWEELMEAFFDGRLFLRHGTSYDMVTHMNDGYVGTNGVIVNGQWDATTTVIHYKYGGYNDD